MKFIQSLVYVVFVEQGLCCGMNAACARALVADDDVDMSDAWVAAAGIIHTYRQAPSSGTPHHSIQFCDCRMYCASRWFLSLYLSARGPLSLIQGLLVLFCTPYRSVDQMYG
jgi:hypothetical protein